jgi:G3E family GTPase
LTKMALSEDIPVYLLTGFLGAGKSTLLNELLSDPGFDDTAVIINEFGDVPVDHLLVRRGETSINQVSTGCLCCSGTTDLRATLFDLHCAVSAGLAPRFSRVIVEMSGLGDPAPLVNALMANAGNATTLRERTVDSVFHLAGCVTLYDVISGPSSAERHFEVLKQIAFADKIVLTKTDLGRNSATKADMAALLRDLHAINASAEIVDRQDVNLAELFSPRPYAAIERGEDVAGWLALEAALAAEARDSSHTHAAERPDRHGQGIRTFSMVRDQPIPEKRFQQFLAVLQSSAGPRLLRVKGIVATEENPGNPLIVHAVQHAVSDPVRLDAWPDHDHRTRLVFITNGIDPEPVRGLFAAVINGTSPSFSRLFQQLGGGLAALLFNAVSKVSRLSRRST